MAGVISLAVGEPDFTTPAAARAAAVSSINDGFTKYTSNYGILPLREAISEYIAQLYGVTYDPQREILVTIGVAEGLDLAFRATLDPGDEVLVPEPSYINYAAGMFLSDAVAVPVRTAASEQFRPDPNELARAVTPRTKAIILGSPSNPTGAVLDVAALRGIAELAIERDLLIYSDEIYARLVYGMEHRSIVQEAGAKERTIYLSGLSKSHAMTGWRVGYACGPGALIEQMMKIRQHTTLCPPATGQYAALEAIRSGEPDVRRMVAEYDRRRTRLLMRLERMRLPCSEPRGAFYAFPSIGPTRLDDETFCDRLLEEEKVILVPGRAFGEAGAGHVRVSYATSIERIDEACDRIERFLGRI